ncbi:hypothetical protein B0I35DRAFT_515185 [Stachybotrys elegans]|uniref:6-methylsalicylate decarboxylase n=1 Tax=Stachybotrys elegans TaxID=80388 RepID=A0A8K0SEI6_9HYPO|nr:hypothetical protein B0I35DRAFT_515185 [Stachybotrys elegans]
MAPKVDVHHHIVPHAFGRAWNANPQLSRALRMPEWTPEDSLAFMAQHDITASIISDPQEVAALVRQMNDFSADVCRQHPGKFGFLATLPSLEDTEACVAEIRRALLDLGAEGVYVLTSYGDKYLGHGSFQPSPVAPITEPRALAKPIVDWTHETTRTATHLITTDTLKKHPNCKIILPHGGGTLPYTANRIAQLGEARRLSRGGARLLL